MGASSGLGLTLQALDVSCHSLGLASCRLQAGVGTPGGQVLGPCPCAFQIHWPVAVYE